MAIRTRITLVAHQRGRTAAEVARQLGLYRSNISAMDAGKRSVSLRLLERLSRLLDCSPSDLLEAPQEALFREPALNKKVEERERASSDGTEKGWVHSVMLAWQRHHRSVKRHSRP